jgi:hypothetical protein
MKRLLLSAVLGTVGLTLTPAVASAQFGRPFGMPLRPLPSLSPLPSPFSLPALPALPSLRPLGPIPNPFGFVPRVGTRVSIPNFGTLTVNARAIAANNFVISRYVAAGMAISPFTYWQGGSYMTGSGNTNSDYILAAQRNLARAQREAGALDAKDEIAGLWKYEKGNNAPMPEVAPLTDPIRVAIAPTDPAMISSGEVLNTLLKEIVRVEAKGARGPSAYVPPLLLADVRFSGSPTADLLNATQQAGSLSFPSAFDDPALAPLRAGLEKDFAAVAVAVQAGRAPEQEKINKFDLTLQKVQDAAAPVIKNLPFEDAIAMRRFLNQLTGALKALKAGSGNGLIDPKWSAEGLTVSDLVKHMAKYKLQFAAAPRGGEESYATLHHDLATYLFVLNQPKK